MSGKLLIRQKGVALVFGLAMLTTLSFLALAAARSALFEEKISGNVSVETRAMLAAESVLMATATMLQSAPSSIPMVSWATAGLEVFDCAGAALNVATPERWAQAQLPIEFGFVRATVRVVRLAGGGIESMPCLSKDRASSDLFLVAAYAAGPDGRGAIMLQRTVLRTTKLGGEAAEIHLGYWTRRGIAP